MSRLNLHQKTSEDISPALVRAALAERGLSLTKLAKRHDREASYFRSALQKPFPKAMRYIARALNARPHMLWPSLFDESDQPIKRVEHYESSAARAIRGGRKAA